MGSRILLLTLVIGAPAWAAPIDEAKAAFAAGKEAFERGDYELALTNYQRANQLVPAPSLQYNIGNCHERLGRYREAAAAFERYLEMAGPATTDDEKEFQEKLRSRIAANKKRAEQSQPPPPQQQQPLPPPTVYSQPPPTYYVPQPPPPPPREYQLKLQKARRARAIALMAVGTALTVAGIGFTADGFVRPCADTGCWLNYAEDWFGITLIVVGTTLWAPGAASFVGAQRQINDLSRPEPAAAPRAFLFHSPTIRF